MRISYRLVSEVSFANRHSVSIAWTKPQEIPPPSQAPELEVYTTPSQFVFTMVACATPDAKQSEAFVATAALFLIFSSSAKEEKVSMRLPAVWRDLWSEFADARKNQADAQNRAAVKELRDLVRERRDQELEDGVLLQGAFRGRAARNIADHSEESGTDRAKHMAGMPEHYQRIWLEKSSTPQFQAMLVSLPDGRARGCFRLWLT